MPPGSPGIAEVAPALEPGNAEPMWLKAGAAEVQLCGTESVPSEAARPKPAVTAGLPIPGAPKAPVPEPIPLFSEKPSGCLTKTPAVGTPDRMSEVAEPIDETPEADIEEPVPEARPVSDVSAADDEVRRVIVGSDDVDDDDIDEAEASPGSALGAAVVSGVDTMEPSGLDTVVVRGATV